MLGFKLGLGLEDLGSGLGEKQFNHYYIRARVTVRVRVRVGVRIRVTVRLHQPCVQLGLRVG